MPRGTKIAPEIMNKISALRETGLMTWEEIGRALNIPASTCQKSYNARHSKTSKTVKHERFQREQSRLDRQVIPREKSCSCCGSKFKVTTQRRMLCSPCFRNGGEMQSYRVTL